MPALYSERAEYLESPSSGTSTHPATSAPPTPTITARIARDTNSFGVMITHTPSASTARYAVRKWHAIVSPRKSAARAYPLPREIARQVSANVRGRNHMPQSSVHTPLPTQVKLPCS